MGCVLSSVDRPTPNPRQFDVSNIDDRGQERNPGRIEIGEQELVLQQPGKDPIRWPLRSLRRYGFDAELFSFESGRRCATGPGIYAFKCHQAEALFNLLQESIIRAGQSEVSSSGHSTIETALSLPTPITAHTSDWLSFRDILSSNPAHPTSRTFDTLPMTNDYVNQSDNTAGICRDYVNHHHRDVTDRKAAHGVRKSRNFSQDSVESHGVKYAELSLPSSARFHDDADDDVDVFTCSSPSMPGSSEQQFKSAYVNLPLPFGGVSGDPASGVKHHEYMNIGRACRAESNTTGVMYAQLDLFGEGAGELGQSPTARSSFDSNAFQDPAETSRRKSDPYASIDFQKTRALSSKVEDETDEGYRKTRHNSTIEVMFPPMC